MFSEIPSLTTWAQECGIQLSASYLLLFSNDLAKNVSLEQEDCLVIKAPSFKSFFCKWHEG